MADFTDVTDVSVSPDISASKAISVVSLFTTDTFVEPAVFQRIYDSGLAQYVYYTLTVANPAPDPGDTVPNHSGSLVAATHEIIKEG